jgi:hypothetical protein
VELVIFVDAFEAAAFASKFSVPFFTALRQPGCGYF